MPLHCARPLLLAGAGRWAERYSRACSPAASIPAPSSCRTPSPPAGRRSARRPRHRRSSLHRRAIAAARGHPHRRQTPGDGRCAAGAGGARRPRNPYSVIAAGRRIATFEKHLPAPGSCGPCPTCRPRSVAASLSPSPIPRLRRRRTRWRPTCCRPLAKSCGSVTRRCSIPVTAVSGSGPAYVFLLAECLAEAGRAAGLDARLAEELARATVSGSAALLEASDLSAASCAKM